MTTLYCDFETYSEVDITKVGAYRYATDPSTEALMLAWAFDDGPVWLEDFTDGGYFPPEILLGGIFISAYNANFERLIFKHCLGVDIPVEHFRCTMVRSYGLAFNGSMDNVAEQFNLGIAKDPRGRALINRFSKPQPKSYKVRRWTRENDPEGWEEFKQYCIQDVEVERKLSKKLAPYPFPDNEWSRYALDQKINDAGVPVDRQLVNRAIEVSNTEKEILKDELIKLTGLPNPNSNQQLQKWLNENGCKMSNMQKATVAQKLTEELPDTIRTALELKQQAAKTSVKKWNAFDKAICADDRVHGMFQFMGASRTWRWAGRIVQLHNLARGGVTTKDPSTAADMMLAGGHELVKSCYGRPMDLLSDTIRSAITAPPGKILNVSDLSSIESRVLGWISGCAAINRAFAEGLCTYKMFATRMYQVAYDEVTSKQRTLSKPPVLGGGYMLGGKGLVRYAKSMGVEMSEEEATTAINILRDGWPEVVAFWAWCKRATFYTTKTGNECEGPHGLKTFAHGEFLFIRLPSGRNIPYYQPEIRRLPAPWDKHQLIECFTYMGVDTNTKKWQRISAHAGGTTENIVQALARDILTTWMERADAAGFTVIGHVHDELICLEDGDRLEELNELIRQPINWAPGLLLDAEGYTARRYKKG